MKVKAVLPVVTIVMVTLAGCSKEKQVDPDTARKNFLETESILKGQLKKLSSNLERMQHDVIMAGVVRDDMAKKTRELFELYKSSAESNRAFLKKGSGNGEESLHTSGNTLDSSVFKKLALQTTVYRDTYLQRLRYKPFEGTGRVMDVKEDNERFLIFIWAVNSASLLEDGTVDIVRYRLMTRNPAHIASLKKFADVKFNAEMAKFNSETADNLLIMTAVGWLKDIEVTGWMGSSAGVEGATLDDSVQIAWPKGYNPPAASYKPPANSGSKKKSTTKKSASTPAQPQFKKPKLGGESSGGGDDEWED